jgi:nucleoside-diphosphate-sugar epimerase
MAVINVLGGSGFVGSEYCRVIEKDHLLIKNDRNNYEISSADVVYFISTVDNYNIHSDPSLDINTNLLTLIKVLENYKNYITKTGEKGCFNFISSWFVYGQDSGYGVNSRGIPETDPCDPKGFYSITKRCAEQLLISYCETFGLNYRILRLANVIGKGDEKVSAKKNALQYLLGEIRYSKPVSLYDGGRFYRDFIDSRDCARGIDLIQQKGNLNEIYNVGNGNPCHFRDILEFARKLLMSDSKFLEIEQKEFHKKVQSSRSFYMDTTKLKQLGYTPKYTIYDSVIDIMNAMQ